MRYQWWLIRVPALLFLPVFFYDIEIIFLISSFFIFHLNSGVKTIINDYLQEQYLRIFLLILVRLTSFEFLRYTLELFL